MLRKHLLHRPALVWLASALALLVVEAALERGLTLPWPAAGLLALGLVGALYLRLQPSREIDRIARERLARDLHEDIGARLLQQLHALRDEDGAARARRTLHELRALIDTLDDRPFTLPDCVGEWRAQLHELCDTAGLALRFDAAIDLPQALLTPAQRNNPARLLCEFVDNAARHARASRIEIALVAQARELRLRARHDGATAHPETWVAARGLRNMRLRAADLDGALHWRLQAPATIEMELVFPLRPD